MRMLSEDLGNLGLGFHSPLKLAEYLGVTPL